MASAAEEAREPWRPGLAQTETTLIADVAAAVAFGQCDESYNRVSMLLASRNCKTRGDLLEWTVAEFYALLKSDTTLKKGRHVYLAALQTALGITLKSDSSCKTESKGKSGGDTSHASRKVVPSSGFCPSKWIPDTHVYDAVPRSSVQKVMDR